MKFILVFGSPFFDNVLIWSKFLRENKYYIGVICGISGGLYKRVFLFKNELEKMRIFLSLEVLEVKSVESKGVEN